MQLNQNQHTTYPAVLGRILSDRREKQGLEQTDIAARLGISQPTWSRFERGETPMTVSMLSKTAHFLNVAPAVILSETDQAVSRLTAMGVTVYHDPPRSNSEAALLIIGGALLSFLIAQSASK